MVPLDLTRNAFFFIVGVHFAKPCLLDQHSKRKRPDFLSFVIAEDVLTFA